MTSPRIARSALAAGAAAFGALGAIAVGQLAGPAAHPVVAFSQAQATEATTTTAAPASEGGKTNPGRERCHDKARLDEATEAKVKEAALAAVPGATYQRGHHDRDGEGYRALLRKSDGTRVLVFMDSGFKVTKVEDPAHGQRRGRGPRPAGDAASAKVAGGAAVRL